MKTVAFVPIRLNSKRVPGKNLRPLAGRPLFVHILHTLLRVPEIDEVYLYASDFTELLPHTPPGVICLPRPSSLDSDLTLGEEIYDAFTAAVPAHRYVLAHATSPFLRAETLSSALAEMTSGAHDSAFSARRIKTFAWYEGKPLNYSPSHIPRTQDIEPVYTETSAFYAFIRELWAEQRRRVGHSPYMAVVDDVEGMDIDYPDDFRMAEIMAATFPPHQP